MADPTHLAVRILIIDDSEQETEQVARHLKRAGMDITSRQVASEEELERELQGFAPGVVICALGRRTYSDTAILRCCQRLAPDVPFLFIAAATDEQRAAETLALGAVDYVLAGSMVRLAPAVRRAIAQAAERQERFRQEAHLARLHRVLQVLSGINSLVLHVKDRTELLAETCRLAVSVGGYSTAIASTRVGATTAQKPVAWSGLDEGLTGELRAYVAESSNRDASVMAKVLRTGKEFVCNNTASATTTATFDALMLHARMLSVVVLPLTVDGIAVATLVLTARKSDVVGAEEQQLLKEFAGSISFGLQYLQRDSKARFLSHFDGQTGLARRQLFWDRVQRVVSEGNHAESRHAVVAMDIVRLSTINDSFGRKLGDVLIQRVAERLKKFYPQTEQIAHFHGGTFALFRPQGTRTIEEIQSFGNRRADEMFTEPFEIDGKLIPVSVRTGFALCPDDGTDATMLVQNAEAALRYARSTGENHVHYSPLLRSRSIDELTLEHQLRFAIERNEFELHYQPKVDVKTRRIEGAEALLRWHKPDGSLVSPGAFLPVLESTGLIVQVGAWVARQAATDCRKWLRSGCPPVRVAINIAAAQLRHPGFETMIGEHIRSWSSRRWGLDVEITESALQGDGPDEIRKLQRLRDQGVKVAIDDFGTGYSSLSRLSALPIDTLKIDRSFIQKIVGNPTGSGLVKTIVLLAKNFNMTTVAEGVEQQEELDLVWHLGCDQSQGYLHSPAVNAAEFAELLRRGKGILMRPAEPEETEGTNGPPRGP